MKKFWIVFLAIALTISTTACSHKSKSNDAKSETIDTSVASNAKALDAFDGSEEAKQSLAKLLSGNENYMSGNITPNISAALRTDLATNGQHPYAIVITCSDSRVPAELILDSSLGDIFVIRTAGNVVSDFEIGSVEYGAEHLGCPLILVLGHTNCGAVTAATEGGEAGGKIQSIIDEIAPSVQKAKEAGATDVLSKAIELNVMNSINRILTSDVINELIEEEKVAVIGGVYDISTGTITIIE
ncbi:MAG: carbonic anhydrase [Lachnospiraceae bacterium]|nr:carbonic anhydrase [Candidatus Colinaster scatohippi]